MKNYFQSPAVSKVILALAILLVILLIFQVGVLVGYRRGIFSSDWNSAYDRGMDDPHFIFAPFIHDGDDINPHGTIGQIVSVHLPSLLIKGSTTAEQTITISSSTTLRFMHSTASTADLAPGDQVIVIGEPQQNGTIDAVFIRIMSQPPAGGLPAGGAATGTPDRPYQTR